MLYYTRECHNPDVLKIFWLCLLGHIYCKAAKPEQIAENFPYHYIFRQWLEIEGILELIIMQLEGSLFIQITKKPEADWEELISKMYPSDDPNLKGWERIFPGAQAVA